jgi:hypothetical protein
MTPEELTRLEQAKRTRYLAKGPENGAETIQAFWQWCTEQGQPCVSVEEKSGSVTLIFDTGTVWEHFLPRFLWLQEKPFFFTLDPTEELQQQVRQVINASGFQGGAGYGGSYTWIRGLPLEQAEPTVQALLRIWEQARSFHLSTLGII